MTRVERLRALALNMLERRRAGRVLSVVVKAGTFQNYPVTYPYGAKSSNYKYGYHTGEDHACPEGSLALATTWGKVIHAGWGGGAWGSAYGIQVIIRTGNEKYDYAFCHLSRAKVEVGDHVHPGMVVGRTGNTGNSSGPHLHFEARVAGGHYGDDVHPMKVKRKR